MPTFSRNPMSQNYENFLSLNVTKINHQKAGRLNQWQGENIQSIKRSIDCQRIEKQKGNKTWYRK